MIAHQVMLKKAIIFDLDGVLLDSMPYYYTAWKAAFRTHGITLYKDEFYDREGEQRRKSVNEIFEKNKGYNPSPFITTSILNEMRHTFFEVFRAELFPCTRELLTALVRKNITLGLVTGSESLEQMLGTEKDLLRLFSAIVTGQETREGKPSPQPYELAIKKLKLSRSMCCVVENAPLGIRAAKAAGLFCIAVRNTSPLPAQKLKQAGADVICSSNKELTKHLMEYLPM